MAVSVAAVMRQINNYFEVGCISGMIAISGAAIAPVPQSPWVCVKGSWLHDGVYRVEDGKIASEDQAEYVWTLPDEEFDGRVWLLKPPPDFLALCKEISAYDDKNPVGAYQQETFGGYSYMRQATGKAGTAWQDVFAGRLQPFRRPCTEVM